MKRKTVILSIAAATLAIGTAAFIAAPTFAHGYKGQGYGMGHGQHMMGGYGQHRMGGPGMKGHGYANCPNANQQNLEKEMTVDDVKAFMQRRLDWRGNERLKVGNVEATSENTIVAEIVTADDSLVRRVEFDTKTGAHRPIN